LKGYYDFICSNSVLEHLPEPVKTVEMFGEHLKPGGQIIVSMARDIHGQHLEQAIKQYDDVIRRLNEINQKSANYLKLQLEGSAWTTKDLHYQQSLVERINWVKPYLNTPQLGILDIGCGDGWSVEEFKRQGINVIGGDIDKVKIEDAVKRNLKVQYMDMHNIESIWDAIFCSHSLEHSYNFKKALNSMMDHLITNGLLFIIVPIEPTDPAQYNPSHTQWFASSRILKDAILENDKAEIIFEEERQRDTLEYWVIVRRKK
jgi:2-polyprenyl-3-methyl-5-hydroxy-6-metoxy-1,4-benzoquinol methylase